MIPTIVKALKELGVTPRFRGGFAYEDIVWNGEPIAESVVNAKIAELEAVTTPNWEALLLHLANGDLYALFERNREIAESSTSVALYRGDIISAITTIKKEEFLASGLGLLQQRAGYEFTEQEIADWNRVTEQLGFSALVRI